ncbi:MAG: hypothetical protein J6A76_00185 [Oscillospiraceae bacterium]|nr:hypothetical protein [Oscillospiraceae bacterium]
MGASKHENGKRGLNLWQFATIHVLRAAEKIAQQHGAGRESCHHFRDTPESYLIPKEKVCQLQTAWYHYI